MFHDVVQAQVRVTESRPPLGSVQRREYLEEHLSNVVDVVEGRVRDPSRHRIPLDLFHHQAPEIHLLRPAIAVNRHTVARTREPGQLAVLLLNGCLELHSQSLSHSFCRLIIDVAIPPQE